LANQKECIPEPKAKNLMIWIPLRDDLLIKTKDEKYPEFSGLPLDVVNSNGLKLSQSGVNFESLDLAKGLDFAAKNSTDSFLNLNCKAWSFIINFTSPLQNSGNKVLVASKNGYAFIYIDSNSMLGTYHANTFHSSSFNMSKLKNGNHQLVAVGVNKKTLFYMDGVYVGKSAYQVMDNVISIGNLENKTVFHFVW
jgi:hypothetical protein